HIVRRARPQSGAIELGARFGTLSPDSSRVLSRFMIREFLKRNDDASRLVDPSASVTISNGMFITSLLRRRAGAAGGLLQVLDGARRLPVRMAIRSVEREGKGGVVRGTLVGDRSALELGRSYGFVLAGTGAVTTFRSRLIALEGDVVALEL